MGVSWTTPPSPTAAMAMHQTRPERRPAAHPSPHLPNRPGAQPRAAGAPAPRAAPCLPCIRFDQSSTAGHEHQQLSGAARHTQLPSVAVWSWGPAAAPRHALSQRAAGLRQSKGRVAAALHVLQQLQQPDGGDLSTTEPCDFFTTQESAITQPRGTPRCSDHTATHSTASQAATSRPQGSSCALATTTHPLASSTACAEAAVPAAGGTARRRPPADGHPAGPPLRRVTRMSPVCHAVLQAYIPAPSVAHRPVLSAAQGRSTVATWQPQRPTETPPARTHRIPGHSSVHSHAHTFTRTHNTRSTLSPGGRGQPLQQPPCHGCCMGRPPGTTTA